MGTSRLKRVVSRSVVVLVVGMALLGGPFAIDTSPDSGTHVAYATDPAGPNPPPDLDRPLTPALTSDN